jgi:hypothetical protein
VVAADLAERAFHGCVLSGILFRTEADHEPGRCNGRAAVWVL